MSAVNFITSLARKILARESKGITKIPTQMAAEAKAGEIAAILQDAGLPLNRADEFIKSEQDLVRILNMIESTPPVMREVPSGIRNTKTAKVMDMEGKEIKDTKNIIGGKELTDSPLDDLKSIVDDYEPMGGKQAETEAEIAARISKENKKGIENIRAKNKNYKLNLFKNLDDKKKLNNDEYEEFLEEIGGDDRLEAYDFDGTAGSAKKILKDDVEYEESMFEQYKAGKLNPEQPKSNKPITFLDNQINEEFQKGMKEGKFNNVRLKDGRSIKSEDDFREYIDELNEDNNFDFAQGGRAGFKLGSIDKARRAFLKTMGAAGAGITALKTGLLSIGKGADAVKNLPPIKTPVTKLTDSTTQMPDWFPSFINKFRDEGKAENVFKTKKVEVSKEEFDQAFKEGKGERYGSDVARTSEYKANNPDHMDYYKLEDTDERIYTTYTNDKVPGVRVDDMDGNVDVMFENDYSQPVSINYTAPGKRGPETGRADVFVQGESKFEKKPKGEFVANDVETYATDPDGGFDTEDVIAGTLDDMMEGKTRQMEEFATGKKVKNLSRGEGRVIEGEIRAEQASDAAAEAAAEAADEFASGGIARMLGE